MPSPQRLQFPNDRPPITWLEFGQGMSSWQSGVIVFHVVRDITRASTSDGQTA